MADIQKVVEIDIDVDTKQVEEASAEVINLDKNIKTVNANTTKTMGGMGKSAVKSFEMMKSASGGFFNAVKAGMASSGIGLIPIILGVIVAYWDDIKAGIEKIFPPFKKVGTYVEAIKNVIGQFSGIFDNFGETVSKVGNYIKDKFIRYLEFAGSILTFQFGKAFNIIKEEVNEVIDTVQEISQAIIDEATRIADLDDEFAKLEKNMELAVARGEETDAMEEELLKNRLARYKEDTEEYKAAQHEMDLFYAKRIGNERKLEEKRIADEEKARQDRIRAYQAEMDKLYSIMKSSRDEIEDLMAESEKEVLRIQRRRELESINSLMVSETEKRKARMLINQKYDLLEDNYETERQQRALDLIDVYSRQLAEMRDKTGKLARQNAYKDEENELYDLLRNELITRTEHQELLQLLNDRYAEMAIEDERLRQEAIGKISDEYYKKERDRLAITKAEKDANYLLDLEDEKNRKIKELEDLNASEEAKQTVLDYYAGLEKDKRREMYEEELRLAEMLKEAKLQMVGQGLEAAFKMTELFAGKDEKAAKKAFNIQKGISMAQATMSGIEGVQNAYKTAQGSPITAVMPVYPMIQAGIAGVFSAMQVAAIAKQKFQGGSGGSTTPTAGGGSVAATPNFNMVGQSTDSVLAETVAGASNQTVQAYVLLDDLEDRQAQRDEQNDYSSF